MPTLHVAAKVKRAGAAEFQSFKFRARGDDTDECKKNAEAVIAHHFGGDAIIDSMEMSTAEKAAQ